MRVDSNSAIRFVNPRAVPPRFGEGEPPKAGSPVLPETFTPFQPSLLKDVKQFFGDVRKQLPQIGGVTPPTVPAVDNGLLPRSRRSAYEVLEAVIRRYNATCSPGYGFTNWQNADSLVFTRADIKKWLPNRSPDKLHQVMSNLIQEEYIEETLTSKLKKWLTSVSPREYVLTEKALQSLGYDAEKLTTDTAQLDLNRMPYEDEAILKKIGALAVAQEQDESIQTRKKQDIETNRLKPSTQPQALYVLADELRDALPESTSKVDNTRLSLLNLWDNGYITPIQDAQAKGVKLKPQKFRRGSSILGSLKVSPDMTMEYYLRLNAIPGLTDRDMREIAGRRHPSECFLGWEITEKGQAELAKLSAPQA